MPEIGGLNNSLLFPVGGNSLTPTRATPRADEFGAGGIDGGQHQTGKSFMDTLKDALGDVNELKVQADAAARDLASGKRVDLHSVMIAAEKAGVAVQTTVAIRNKLVEAYNEVLRMQV